jgi:carboxypeptidase Taq
MGFFSQLEQSLLMTEKNEYDLLAKRMKDIYLLGYTKAIVDWDTKVYMPSDGYEQRAEGLGILDTHIHDMFVSEQTGELLKKSYKLPNLTDIQKRNLYLWQRDYDHETKVPSELVQQLTEQASKTEHIWEGAKNKSDFKMVKPELEKLFELTKKKAAYLNPDISIYDSLLDIYEPHLTQTMVTDYFNVLKTGIMKVLKGCVNCADQPDDKILKQSVPESQQEELSSILKKLIGMDTKRSRLDKTEHPFTTGYGDDVRITTHYLEKDVMASFYSVMHEAGHARYELDLPKEHMWTAVGQSCGMATHESQSRFIENICGRSEEFLSYIFLQIKKIVPAFADLTFKPFIRAINVVKPSKIRIYSDEVTYSLHVIMRYEIERDLCSGKISIADLPNVWVNRMQEYLGVKIDNDKEGVLQDVHWYGGMFGYFPSYALGNIYDGQFLRTLKKDIPNWKIELKSGNFNDVIGWMDKNIHKKGFMYDSINLVEKITGEKPNAQYFVDYLNEKYKKIYGF